MPNEDTSTSNDPEVRAARFGAVYLVCKACGKRGSGPKKLKPKEVAGLVRRASRSDAVRPRVVLTTCLGLCPKKATAVARVAKDSVTRIVAITERNEVDRAVLLLGSSFATPSVTQT